MAATSFPFNASGVTENSVWRGLDWMLLLVVLTLSVWGCLTVVSATLARDDASSAHAAMLSDASTEASQATPSLATPTATSDAVKQAVWIGVGLAVMLTLACFDFQWLIHLQAWLYGLNLLALTLVLVLPARLAPVINGAKSWIRLGPLALQPAEFAKFFVLVTLAAFVCHRQEKIRSAGTVASSLFFVTPVLLLVLKQPDFGTMLAILCIWFGVMFFGGARLRHLGFVALCGTALFCALWHSGKLKPHQKERLAVFLMPDDKLSPRNAGYQVKQSQIAIGAGQVTGQGFGLGMQKRGGWVPENSTDFVFTVVAEELGFAGGAALIALYLLLLLRAASVATVTDNYFGVLLAGGFTALLAYHAIINLGMTMRVMPITGVPLPFFSYGGSSYLSFAAGAGLLQSIVVRQRRTGMW